MKNILFSFFCFLALLGCVKNSHEENSLLHSNDIVKLIRKANDTNLVRIERLKFAGEINDLIADRENDSLTRSYLFRLAETYYNNGDDESYLKVCRKTNKLTNEANDISGQTRSSYFIATYHYLKFNMDSAYYYYSRAERSSMKLAKQPYLGSILFSKANLLSMKKDFSRSEALTIKALKIALNEKNYVLAYDCYLNLGNVLLGMNNYDNAIWYFHKAYETTNKLKGNFRYLINRAQPFNYLGKVYQKKGEYNEAIKCFEKGLSFADFKKIDPTIYCYLMSNLAYSKMKLGDENTGIRFKQILTIADSIHNIPVQITGKKYLSEYYLDKGDFSNAIFYANEARKMAHKNKIFEDELTCLEFLGKIDHKNHSKYTERFISLSDSLQNIERAARDKYARIEFETDEIIKQKKYIISERDYLATQRWAILIFSILLISILTLWYVFNLQKSKNKELQFIQQQQQQNEEIYRLMLDQHQKVEEGKLLEKKRISQELHDGVMGRLSGIRLNLYALSRRTDQQTIDKCLEQVPRIQEIEREIRNISHNLSNNMLSENTNFMLLIKALFQDMRSHSRLEFEVDIDPEIEWETINNHIKINIYRIIQEALFNIDKYAEAKMVILKMYPSANGINVSIADDGIGFDTQKSKNGIGLKNMKSRISDLKGEIEIVSKLSQGTKINFYIPT